LSLLAGAVCLVLTNSACAEEQALSRCEVVPLHVVDAIATGLQGGGTLRDVQAVESNDFERVYFISAEIDSPGIAGDGAVGTWARSGSLDEEGGAIYSVDSAAKDFSDWIDGGSTDAETTMDNDGAEESRECVETS
jgi:hypothetical protein